MARYGRLGAPEHLGAVLLRSTDARAPVAVDAPPVAPRDWELAVGTKIARRARPTKLDRGVLHVRAASAGWTQELSLLADAIVEKLRARGLDVRSLRFHVGAVEPLARPAWRTETRVSPGPAALPAEVKRSLAAVPSPELRDAIARAAAVSLGHAEKPAPAPPPRARRPARERSPEVARDRSPDVPPDRAPADAAVTSPKSAAPARRSAAQRSAPPDRTRPARPSAPRGTRGGSSPPGS